MLEKHDFEEAKLPVGGKIIAENMCWERGMAWSIGTVVVLTEVRLCAAGRRKVSDRLIRGNEWWNQSFHKI
jgi:hypothetical protein